jgi:hypothetical protein
MLSAYDYGQRALQKGHPNAFSYLADFQKSLDFIMEYVRIWERWTREKNVLIARYEDLLTDYDREAARLAQFLQLNGSSPEIQKVIGAYRPGAAQEGQQGLHFYKGKIGRFRESYGAQEQATLKEKLGPFLTKMGYEV